MRYLILVILNLPLILLALTSIVTQYKLGKISSNRFKFQLTAWLVILIVLLGSFPIYNYLSNNAILDANSLSAFDIAEITAIVYLLYGVNNQRRKIEQNEKLIRELHQELSIKLSGREV